MHRETFDRLDEYARRSGRNRTAIAEEAIHEYLSRRGIPGQWPLDHRRSKPSDGLYIEDDSPPGGARYASDPGVVGTVSGVVLLG